MIHSKRSLEGYLLIDHHASPGNALVPEGATFESATITCSHCHRIVILNPNRSRPRNYCSKCDKYICDVCATIPECNPLNKIFDELKTKAEKELILKQII